MGHQLFLQDAGTAISASSNKTDPPAPLHHNQYIAVQDFLLAGASC